MADQPTAKFDNHENDQLKSGQQQGAEAAARMSHEASTIATNDSKNRTNDRTLIADAVGQGDTVSAEKFPPKTNPEQFKGYATAVASMPQDGIGSQADAKAVVDYFKTAYPQNFAFNTGVERAVLT